MKVLIVLSALVAVCLAKPGYLSLSAPADTPEVAAAKAAHFAAYNAAAARSAGVVAVAPSYGYAAYGPANIVIGADGVPLDTPEVAARKAADAVAHARAAAGLPAVGPVPAAVVPAVVGSVPADTPEVAAAKAAHAAAHVEATVRNAAEAVGIRGLYGVVPSVYSYGVVPGAYSVHYDGTLLTPDGVPLDTPAVAAGKVANAVAHIQAKSGLIV